MKSGVTTSLLLAFCLAACQRASNRFVVTASVDTVQSATVRLCNSQTGLGRRGDILEGSAPANCEGEGDIMLRLSNGRTALCRIGYVTPGAGQVFSYVVEKNQCHPVAESR